MKPFVKKIDIRNSLIYTGWEFVQGDTDAYPLFLSVVDGGIPFDLTDCTATITWKRGNGTIVVASADKINIEDNTIEYLVESSVYAIPGSLDATVEIYKDNARLTAIAFTAKVRAELLDGSEIPSTNEYPILTSLIQQNQEFNNVLNDAISITQAVQEALSNVDNVLMDVDGGNFDDPHYSYSIDGGGF